MTYDFENEEFEYEPADKELRDALISCIKKTYRIDNADCVYNIIWDIDAEFNLIEYFEEELEDYFYRDAYNEWLKHKDDEPDHPSESWCHRQGIL